MELLEISNQDTITSDQSRVNSASFSNNIGDNSKVESA